MFFCINFCAFYLVHVLCFFTTPARRARAGPAAAEPLGVEGPGTSFPTTLWGKKVRRSTQHTVLQRVVARAPAPELRSPGSNASPVSQSGAEAAARVSQLERQGTGAEHVGACPYQRSSTGGSYRAEPWSAHRPSIADRGGVRRRTTGELGIADSPCP